MYRQAGFFCYVLGNCVTVLRLKLDVRGKMIPGGPEDMDVDPRREHAFRRGYVSGIYDALLGVKSKLTHDEFSRLEAWVQQSLSPWTTTNLEKAVRPPTPSDPTLLSAGRHQDGPFTLR